MKHSTFSTQSLLVKFTISEIVLLRKTWRFLELVFCANKQLPWEHRRCSSKDNERWRSTMRSFHSWAPKLETILRLEVSESFAKFSDFSATKRKEARKEMCIKSTQLQSKRAEGEQECLFKGSMKYHSHKIMTLMLVEWSFRFQLFPPSTKDIRKKKNYVQHKQIQFSGCVAFNLTAIFNCKTQSIWWWKTNPKETSIQVV